MVFQLACQSAERSPPPSPPPQPADSVTSSANVGLAAIRARGKLRLLTRSNGTSYFVWHGRTMGFDYELASRFAKWLQVGLDVVVPTSWGDLLPMLKAGQGDLAAAGLTVTPEREKEVRFTKPYTLTHMRVVWGKGRQRITSPEELSGKSVHVRMNSAYYRRLVELSGLLESTGKRPIDIVLEGEDLETEELLEEVATGRIPYTLCDIQICNENRSYLPDLVIGPRVSDPQALAWAVHPQADDLAREVDRFFDEMKKSGELDALYQRYYESPRRRERARQKPQTKRGSQLSPFDTQLKDAAARASVDWRLLAAIAFEESGFDPKNENWNGGTGLFGIMPNLARELGFEDMKNPTQAAQAAAQHLSQMGAQFASVANEDDRLRLTIAAFSCGLGHITDARLLATSEKHDPDVWANVARALRLLSRGEYAARAQHGYVRGSEIAAYVDRVWSQYRAYRHALGDRDGNR